MDETTKLKVDVLHFEAQERQKQQRNRQIVLPIVITGVVLLIVLAGAIVLAVKDYPCAGYKVGKITLIIDLFLALLLGAFIIFILIKAIGGLYKLNQTLPTYGKKALGGVVQAEEAMRTAADASVKPVLAVQEFGTKVKQVGKSVKDRMSPEGK